MINNRDCLICIDNETELTYTIKDINKCIIVSCTCNGYYHKKCLQLWLQKSCSCPICRKQIIIQEYNENNFYKNICINVYNKICNFVSLSIKIVLLFIAIHFIIVITVEVIKVSNI
jgi:hypothetical protein